MAWGDHARLENAANKTYNTSQGHIDDLRQSIQRQNHDFENRNTIASDQAFTDYGNIMGNYGNFLNGPKVNTNFGALPGYQNFADTGGYSDRDMQDLRQRAIDPLRGVYSQAKSELNRNRALQGGYSPNFAAAQSQMARQLGHQVADTNVSVNAGLADAVRQGKLAGLGGITDINKAQSQEGIANRGMDLSALSGMSSLYSATPGLASTFGNQELNSTSQLLNTEGLQNNIGDSFLKALQAMSQTPGNTANALGTASSVLGLVGQGASAFSGLGKIPGLGGGKNLIYGPGY